MNNRKLKIAAIVLNCILCAATIAFDVVFTFFEKTLLMKGIASAGFVLVGIVCFVWSLKIKADVKFPAIMLCGLVFAMAGDIVLNIHFIAGAALFAVGHVLYVCSYMFLQKFKWTDLIAGLCVFVPAVLFITLAPIFDFGGILMEIVCIVYGLILSCMLGKAISLLIRKQSALHAMIAIGSILFFVSDFALLINMFAIKNLATRVVCLGTYYPAQLLLALSIFVYCTAKEGKMSVLTKAFSRIYQGIFKLLLPILPYKDPEIIDKVEEIPAVLEKNGKKKPLLVTDKTIYSFGLCAGLEASLKEHGFDYALFDEVVANPTSENVENALQLYKNENCDCMIAFGGGSPMDCAKGVGARFIRPKKSLAKLGGILKVRKKIPLLIAVPTTAGTGSETTLACVIVDGKTRHKYAINDFPLIPSYAVLDEEVTLTMPPRVATTTGMDALTHAIEAYIGKSGNKSTRKDALEAIKLIFENIEISCNDKTREARKNMLVASHKAGRAFSKAYVGYVHAVAHSLGGKYDTPHGLANAVLLPVVLRKYGKTIFKKLNEIALFCGLTDNATSPAEGAEVVIKKIEGLNGALNIPKTLTVHEEDVDELTEYAYKEATPLYPVPVLWGKAELKEIYKSVANVNE
ncbi:MAG: iron-containing alcohol dehydrogenase [Clostridia bacterium]|nr:iron-containing alcohol dehydrogenase [Clostridia bacterium]